MNKMKNHKQYNATTLDGQQLDAPNSIYLPENKIGSQTLLNETKSMQGVNLQPIADYQHNPVFSQRDMVTKVD